MPTGVASPITPSVDLVVGDAHGLDRAVGGAHAAADLRGLEGRPGGRGGREQALDVAERDLAVRADVDEQPQPLVARHAGGQQARDDVAADVRAERREDVRVRARVHGDAEVGRAHERVARRGHDERRHADRLGIDAEQQLRHRRVAGERDLVDLVGRHLALLAAPRATRSASVPCASSCSFGSTVGSIIVAEMRRITSAP